MASRSSPVSIEQRSLEENGLIHSKPRQRWRDLCLLGLTFSTALYRISATVADPDLWGHLRFGEDILMMGDVPRTDPYSYLTGGQAWINHEWLAEAIFFWVYDHGGAAGLIVFKVALCLAALIAIFRKLLEDGLSYARASIITIWVTLLILPGVSSIRPQIFTYVLFLLLLLILQRQRAAAKPIWWIPIIFLFWVNLHGGFLAGMAALLVWMGIRLVSGVMRLDHSWRKELPYVFTVLVAMIALLVNPYGSGLLSFLLRPETVMRPEIMEWGSLEIFSNYGGFLLALIVFSGVCLWFSQEKAGDFGARHPGFSQCCRCYLVPLRTPAGIDDTSSDGRTYR